jgi:hypothetical protein
MQQFLAIASSPMSPNSRAEELKEDGHSEKLPLEMVRQNAVKGLGNFLLGNSERSRTGRADA